MPALVDTLNACPTCQALLQQQHDRMNAANVRQWCGCAQRQCLFANLPAVLQRNVLASKRPCGDVQAEARVAAETGPAGAGAAAAGLHHTGHCAGVRTGGQADP